MSPIGKHFLHEDVVVCTSHSFSCCSCVISNQGLNRDSDSDTDSALYAGEKPKLGDRWKRRRFVADVLCQFFLGVQGCLLENLENLLRSCQVDDDDDRDSANLRVLWAGSTLMALKLSSELKHFVLTWRLIEFSNFSEYEVTKTLITWLLLYVIEIWM